MDVMLPDVRPLFGHSVTNAAHREPASLSYHAFDVKAFIRNIHALSMVLQRHRVIKPSDWLCLDGDLNMSQIMCYYNQK